jgi:hypothetical protein
MNHRRFSSATQPRYCPECAKLGSPVPSPLFCTHGVYAPREQRLPRPLPRWCYMPLSRALEIVRSWFA